MTKNRVSGERLFASLNILLLHKDDRADDDDDDDDGDDENDDDDDDDDDDDVDDDDDNIKIRHHTKFQLNISKRLEVIPS